MEVLGSKAILDLNWSPWTLTWYPPDILGVGLAQLHAEIGARQVRVRRTDSRLYQFVWRGGGSGLLKFMEYG